eukprot:TRINITY_DN4607_c0_g4_i8.p1 TRINITY_DN4607_c0_g4~~TRINITY_DN4607_c0_g4_i8.p1  ORF type:complete len:930 (+),score=126.32 TRINITY_DN4607_c0_g4_i8:73-2862(+)
MSYLSRILQRQSGHASNCKDALRLHGTIAEAANKSWSLSDMPTAYEPRSVENYWSSTWTDTSKNTNLGSSKDEKESFAILLPPPNVTGSLHLGHALTISIQDALIRWQEMNGRNALWIPGTDHAGIATQVVVEKRLSKERGITRHDLGRDEFLRQVWDWKEKYGNVINSQIARLGTRLDWKREYFTMDPQRSRAVTEAFNRLHTEGLIYRDMRIVSWCCHLGTAISDIEVDQMEVEKRTSLKLPNGKGVDVGLLYTFDYVTPDGERLPISTTRPETIIGDVAVAIHPLDPRYKHLHGRSVVHPVSGRQLPIVCDENLVDMTFGTGAVKVTPGHDPSDFECARRNNLPIINIMNDDGSLNSYAGSFKGLHRYEARKEILNLLESKGLLKSVSDHKMVISRCSRSGDILEPLVKPQWYVRCKDLARKALALVDSGEITISPSFYKADWNRWLENIHDWCISRQLWWGHRIPAYRIITTGEDSEKWVVASTEEAAKEQVFRIYNLAPGQYTLSQDEDVLDTWFSSALLPMSSLGWPDNHRDLTTFYPTSILETGSDILFFWVARMVMLCTHLHGQPPFRHILLHPVIRDSQGRKMSKSLGNVIDPVHVIEGRSLDELQESLLSGNLEQAEIKRATQNLCKEFPKGIEECGADALRFSLISYLQQDRQINLDVNRVVATRHFCNKIWNASRFILSNLPEIVDESPIDTSKASTFDKWILSRLHHCVKESNAGLESLDLSRSTLAFQSFFISELCDVYLETSKVSLKGSDQDSRKTTQQILRYTLETSLKLLHPFMPFLSEELWAYCSKSNRDNILVNTKYPHEGDAYLIEDITSENEAKALLATVQGLRSLKQQYSSKVDWSTPAGIVVQGNESQIFYEKHIKEIGHLSKLHHVSVTLSPPQVFIHLLPIRHTSINLLMQTFPLSNAMYFQGF